MAQFSWPPVQVSTAGIATEATLATVAKETTLAAIDGKLGTLGQKAMSGSAPVVIASDQSAVPVSGPLTDTQLRASNVNVAPQVAMNAGAASASTQRVIAASDSPEVAALGAQADAAASSDTGTFSILAFIKRGLQNWTTLLTRLTLGQSTMANSLRVAIASDQSAIGVTPAHISGSGNITTQNLNPTSGAATAGSTVSLSSPNSASVIAQITGTYTGALTPQVTVDGTNWIALSATSVLNLNTNATAATIASGATGVFKIAIPSCATFRLSANAAVTGTAVVTLRADATTRSVSLLAPIPAGTAIIGALSANQSTNVAQINGVAPLMGAGVTGTGSPRVTIVSDQVAIPTIPTPAAAQVVKQAAVSFGTTAVRLTTDAAAPAATRRKLLFIIEPGGADNFFMGGSTVTSSGATRGIRLYPGTLYSFDNDANDYFIISDTASQTVFVTEVEP